MLLNESFEAVVSDFGLARITVDSNAKSGVTRSMVGPIKVNIPLFHLFVNNLGFLIQWMAPESILKGSYSVSSDAWSFGIT